MENYVNSVVLYTPFIKVEYVLVVQRRSGTGRGDFT